MSLVDFEAARLQLAEEFIGGPARHAQRVEDAAIAASKDAIRRQG